MNWFSDYDKEGFHKKTGYHKETGLDRQGFDQDGFDKHGYDAHGFNADGNLRIHSAAVKGDVKAVQEELERGVDVNIVDKFNLRSPLFVAAMNNQTEVMTELLIRGADVDKTNCDGNTPLTISCSIGH